MSKKTILQAGWEQKEKAVKKFLIFNWYSVFSCISGDLLLTHLRHTEQKIYGSSDLLSHLKGRKICGRQGPSNIEKGFFRNWGFQNLYVYIYLIYHGNELRYSFIISSYLTTLFWPTGCWSHQKYRNTGQIYKHKYK